MDYFTLITPYDIELFRSGKHYRMYDKLGSHFVKNGEQSGVFFAVWAPGAESVHLIGNFNGWNREAQAMQVRWDGSGIWELFVPDLQAGEAYKYFIKNANGYSAEKGDPYARNWEMPPRTASITWQEDYQWKDKKWSTAQSKKELLKQPISIYEMHIGSWKRPGDDGNRFLSYRELAELVPAYCFEMGFTHVEFLPVMEHPFYGSWGYQVTGFFAPSSRFGNAEDFMFLVDSLHAKGIGVILDWVPAHFPTDEFGPGYFDGSHLYEHPDPNKGFHPDWKTFIFNYGRNEVRSFLISNALYWLDKYHIDGLRVDAVASMLYLDYSRNAGEWKPNENGGRENLEAIGFLKDFNAAVKEFYPDVLTIAEESTAFPGVTAPVAEGGLGFDLKWMMGWMHDTLNYFQEDPLYRRYHQDQFSFSMVYAFTEKFVLPLSHDEVVHGKESLINKMPGDEWQKYANLRALYGCMWGHPGAKMIFMGDEFAQDHEWQHDFSLDWHELENPFKSGVQQLVRDLNVFYRKYAALYTHQYSVEGFEWIDQYDSENSVFSWMRKGDKAKGNLIFVANLTPNVHHNYRIGVPDAGKYRELLNTDERQYGGSGTLNETVLPSFPIGQHGREQSILLTLPPLAVVVLGRV